MSPAAERWRLAVAARHGGTRRSGTNGGDRTRRRPVNMGYGIGGVLILILVILAIIYFAKRV